MISGVKYCGDNTSAIRDQGQVRQHPCKRHGNRFRGQGGTCGQDSAKGEEAYQQGISAAAGTEEVTNSVPRCTA
jgi:hypothetical protein